MSPALLLTACLLAAPAVGEGDWPQWRGPNRDGKSLETGLFKNWPKDGPKVAWENLKIGHGYGSPAVVGDKVYILGGDSNKPGDAEYCICLNLKDGKEVWKTPLETSDGGFNAGWGGGTRSTPTFADGKLFCLGATGDLACLNAETGKQAWKKNLVKDFGGAIPTWGYSESPLVDGDKLVVTPGKGTGMVALNAKTGATVWTCKEFNDGAGYSSILPVEVGNVRIYLQQTMGSSLAVRAKDGKLMFKNSNLSRRVAVIPSPVFADNCVFFTAGYNAGCEAYKLSASGDTVKAEEIYSKNSSLSNHHGGVIQVGDKVYGHSDRGGWTCLDFTKKPEAPAWTHGRFGKGSITYADGHFLCYAEGSGDLAVIKATDAGWEQVGGMKLPKKSKTPKASGLIWAHPVVAHGKLFLRDFDYLFCFDLKK
jgi:outer membrane protein assembly factor BamB